MKIWSIFLILSSVILLLSGSSWSQAESPCSFVSAKPSYQRADTSFMEGDYHCAEMEARSVTRSSRAGGLERAFAFLILAKIHYKTINDPSKQQDSVTAAFEAALRAQIRVANPGRPFNSAYQQEFENIRNRLLKRMEHFSLAVGAGTTLPIGKFADHYNSGKVVSLSGIMRFARLRAFAGFDRLTHKRNVSYIFNDVGLHDHTTLRDLMIIAGVRYDLTEQIDARLLPFMQAGVGLTFTNFSFDLTYDRTGKRFQQDVSDTKLALCIGTGARFRISQHYGVEFLLRHITKTSGSNADAIEALPRFDSGLESFLSLSFALIGYL
ncbi:MAG: hypothetical protein NT002_00965 [candidate division Zixibacteria bacterium]|nr:hypothetical protein [candidate division Zixibacteria bacterium]